MEQTLKRGDHPAGSRWSLAYEQLMLSHLHSYCMYLEVATHTMRAERRADYLASAARMHDALSALTPQLGMLPPVMRSCIHAELARLDEQRAALCAVAQLEALSLMYPTTRAEGSAASQACVDGDAG